MVGVTGRRVRGVDLAALQALPPLRKVSRKAMRGCLVDDVREGLVLADVVPVDQREVVAEQLGAWFDRTAAGLDYVEHLVQGLDERGVQQVLEYAQLLLAKGG